MTEIAGWNSLTLDRLARSGHVNIPGIRGMTGEQVTDRPELATARLTGHFAPVPNDVHNNVTATYRTLRTTSSSRARPCPPRSRASTTALGASPRSPEPSTVASPGGSTPWLRVAS